MTRVSQDPDRIPPNVELIESVISEEIPKKSKIITLNISYTGPGNGVVSFTDASTGEEGKIISLREIDENVLVNDQKTLKVLDVALHSIIGDNNKEPIVVKIKAHKDVPYKYIRVVKQMLVILWTPPEDNAEYVYRMQKSEADLFKFYFATNMTKDSAQKYMSLLSSYGLGGDDE
jgi:hypothetical protein